MLFGKDLPGEIVGRLAFENRREELRLLFIGMAREIRRERLPRPGAPGN